MTTPSHNDALEIAQQLVTDEYDTGITEESFLARAIALIEPKLRERDETIARLTEEAKQKAHEFSVAMNQRHEVTWKETSELQSQLAERDEEIARLTKLFDQERLDNIAMRGLLAEMREHHAEGLRHVKNQEREIADLTRTLKRELAVVKQERDELKTSLHAEIQRDGNWTDKWGACRVCGGEIPHGHTDNCDLFKYEKQITAHQAWEKQARELVQSIADEANSHHEYNPVDKVARLPKGYGNILNMASDFLSTPPASGGTQT